MSWGDQRTAPRQVMAEARGRGFELVYGSPHFGVASAELFDRGVPHDVVWVEYGMHICYWLGAAVADYGEGLLRIDWPAVYRRAEFLTPEHQRVARPDARNWAGTGM